MSGPLLAPGVYVQEEQTIGPVPTQSETVHACVGLAERGPIDEAVLINGEFDDWQRVFGGYTSWNLETVGPVRQFFENGGRVMRFCRTVHHSDPSNPASRTSAKATKTLLTASLVAGSGTVLCTNAAPYNMEPGDTLVVGRDALGNATATFSATAAIRASVAGPFALVNNDTLTLAFDGGTVQTVTFTTGMFVAIGAATAAEVAAAINGQITGGKAQVNGSAVELLSDRRGTGSGTNVTGGSANAGKLGYTTGNLAGTGNVSNIDAVTSAEVKTVVEAAVGGITVTAESSRQRFTSNTTGGSSQVQIQASSTLDTVMGFDNASHTGNAAGAVSTLRIDGKSDGTYGNEIVPRIDAPSSGIAGEFNLVVLRNGIALETWPNLSMVDTAPRYVERIVNDAATGSAYVTAVDLDAAIAFPLDVPATGSFGALAGGGDGLASLDDNDFIGGSSANGQVGLRTFDAVEPQLLSSPARATPAVHNAMVTYCVGVLGGKCYPLIDPPAGYSDAQIEAYFTTTASLRELSEHGCFDWPRIAVANPNRAVYGEVDTVVVPPSGTRAGICARVDASKIGGQFDQPAGKAAPYLPRNVLGLETEAVNKKAVRDRLAPLGINCIRKSKSGPIFFDGSANLKQTGAWPSIGQRRGIIFVIRQLEAGLEIYGHRPITPDLLRDEKSTVDQFMLSMVESGLLASRVPSEAFFSDFGTGLNKASTARAKTTKGRLGIATAFPNVYTVLIVGPDNRALEAELAAALG